MEDKPKPKRKYNRRSVKKQPEKEDVESLIASKIVRGEKPTDDDFQAYFAEFGFNNGTIPEPVELPLNQEQGNPAKKPKRCPKGTRRNKNGDCVSIHSSNPKGKIVIHPEEGEGAREPDEQPEKTEKPEKRKDAKERIKNKLAF
jgi:hypothetical protein